jgi:uncharacterized protein
MAIERRCFACEIRAVDEAGKPKIIGNAAVFGMLSEDMGGWREMISAGAFDGVLGQDTIGAFNHDPSLILGRTTAGTLRLAVNETGLGYEIDPPDTSYARDLLISIGRGDVRQSSFAFIVAREGDRWIDPTPATPYAIRIIDKFERLYDVSPVTYPAYPDTSADVRDMAKRILARGGASGADQIAAAAVARGLASRRRILQLMEQGG